MTAVTTRVLIRGTGLIGTSLGIALTRTGYAVLLADPSPTAERLARDLGAGQLAHESAEQPDLVIIAAPPDVAAGAVAQSLSRWPSAVVTDVASVKGAVVDGARAAGADLTRYVGSHPMAGRERSGAGHARGDLFEGRAWVVVPAPESTESTIQAVTELARAVGSVVTVMDATTHDDAVATMSHLPQIAASLVAAQLRSLDDRALRTCASTTASGSPSASLRSWSSRPPLSTSSRRWRPRAGGCSTDERLTSGGYAARRRH